MNLAKPYHLWGQQLWAEFGEPLRGFTQYEIHADRITDIEHTDSQTSPRSDMTHATSAPPCPHVRPLHYPPVDSSPCLNASDYPPSQEICIRDNVKDHESLSYVEPKCPSLFQWHPDPPWWKLPMPALLSICCTAVPHIAKWLGSRRSRKSFRDSHMRLFCELHGFSSMGLKKILEWKNNHLKSLKMIPRANRK